MVVRQVNGGRRGANPVAEATGFCYTQNMDANEAGRHQMFSNFTSQEIINLAHTLASANGKICKTYGADSILNTELLNIWDEIEAAADVYGIVL